MNDRQPFCSLTMYGIKNCDTIKKARLFLARHQIDVHFHDYRKNGISRDLLQGLIDKVGFATLLNTRGTTWRKLPDELRQTINTPDAAIDLMLSHPAIIKRPLLRSASGAVLAGFSEATYQQFVQETSSYVLSGD